MNFSLPFSPEQASAIAPHIDLLYLYLVAVSLFFTVLIFILVLVFAIKYRRKYDTEEPRPVKANYALEIAWSVIPLLIAMTMFVWGSVLFFKLYRPPQDADEIFVVGKQWMWKIQHPEGRREINELHVPVGRSIKLKMTSEDVIHSFYIPAFRTKMDVVPGRYTHLWFKATKPGRYHLFCAEYCGTDHSGMIGTVVAMEPKDYERWLESGAASELSAALTGAQLFEKHRCITCHNPASASMGPEIPFGAPVKLADGSTVIADEEYIRESILRPNAKVVAGYTSIMPTYQGQITEEEIIQIIEYIKSMNQSPAVESAGVPVPAERVIDTQENGTPIRQLETGSVPENA